MKIPELKIAIANHTKEDLQYIVAELYKLIPKAKKEGSDIDTVIVAGKPSADAPKVKKEVQGKSMDVLKSELEDFIFHATSQHYLGKDRAIHKKDRPKWRFTCRALVKDLFEMANREKESRPFCIEYLDKIYDILCIGGNHHYFSAEDTFASIGYEEAALCMDIIRLYYSTFNVQKATGKAVDLVLKDSDAPNSYFPSREKHFYALIDTDDKIEALLQYGKLKVEESLAAVDAFWVADKKKRYSASFLPYNLTKTNEYTIKMVMQAMILKEEEEEAVAFYHQNIVKDKDSEINLYILVQWLLQKNVPKLILSEIEKAVERGISPRDSLVKLHKEILSSV